MKIYSFTRNYANLIIQLFRRMNEPFNSKISLCYLTEIRPLLKYFKEISSVYSSLSNEMKKLKSEKEIENDGLLLGNDSYNIVHKTNEVFDDNFKTISSEIKKNILTTLSFSKIDSVSSKFDANNKKMVALINELEHKKIDYEKLYGKNYEKQFHLFKSQIKSPDILTIIQEFDDYVIIEQNLISASNQMFIDINHFFRIILNKNLMHRVCNFNLLRTHAFFHQFDFDRLESFTMTAPFIPDNTFQNMNISNILQNCNVPIEKHISENLSDRNCVENEGGFDEKVIKETQKYIDMF